ncbi:MAG: T9SS type A sorting domain-containing protein [Flavobacteriales bacterium]
MTRTRTLTLAGALLLASPFFAQLPLVDITWVTLPTDQIEVRMRPDGPFSSLFSSCVFTVRWLDGGSQGLGTVEQEPAYSACVPVAKSGGEQVSGIYRYQVFYGSSLTSFPDAELAWEGDQEYVVCRINTLGGAASYEVVNDEWTGVITNNGDYYVSLEGQDRTGEIYTLFTEVEDVSNVDNSVRIAPNPAVEQTQVTVERDEAARNVDIILRDAMGRQVRSLRRDLPAGTQVIAIDLNGLAAGAYGLEVHAPEGIVSKRLVVAEQR